MRGRLLKIWENQGKRGKYWTLSINGELYAAWDHEQIAGLKEGDMVEFTFNAYKNFRNLVAAKKVSEESIVAPAADARPGTLSPIVKIACLQAAASLLAGSPVTHGHTAREVLRLAVELEQYFAPQDDPSADSTDLLNGHSG